jgi:Protein of unknown function (DUF2971)
MTTEQDRHFEDRQELLGSTLYRYRDLSDDVKVQQVCDSITNSSIYWPSPKTFNDPFDSRPAFVFEGSNADHRRRAKESANLLHAGKPRADRRRAVRKALDVPKDDVLVAMRQAREQELERFGVVCLTTVKDDILMWSHYAGSHSGVCLGYKPSADAMDFAYAYRVMYQKSRPQFNLMHSMVEQNIFEALVTKSDSWSYEKEWRMLNHRIENRTRPYPPAALVEIVFGYDISDTNRDAIVTAVSKSKSSPKFFSTRPSETHFSLNLEPGIPGT